MQRKNMKYPPVTTVVLLTISFFLLGCRKNSEFKEKLIALDSILVSYPDSVYEELVKMDSCLYGQSYSNQMYYHLLRSDSQNKAYIDFTTDSIMKIVAEYYDSYGTPNEKMRAYYILGCTYRDMKDAPMELQCFQEAIGRADTTIANCDYYTLVSIYGQMANIYNNQHLPHEELSALAMCEKYAVKDNDPITAVTAYELRLRSYLDLNLYDSVLSVSENARKRYLALGDKRRAARLLNPAINILLDRGEYVRAKEYIDIFKTESDYFTGNEITDSVAYIHYRSIGRYALYKNEIDSAKFYFYKLLEKKEDESAYLGLLSVYEKTGQSDSTLKYSKLYADANDSSHYDNKAVMIAKMTAMYNYGREKHNAEMVKTQLLVEKGKSTILLVIMCIIVITVYALYCINSRNRRITIEKIKALNLEIEHKSLLLNETLTNNGNDAELYTLRKSLDEVQKELRIYKKSDALAAFFDSDLYKLFQNIGQKGNNKITNDEWRSMSCLFDTTFSSYTDFIHTGKSMTEDQIRVCMLIRMGFGETEMANILGVDLKRISRVKLQINLKLFNVANAKDLVPNLRTVF